VLFRSLLRQNREAAVEMLTHDINDPSQGLIYRMHIPLLLARLGGLAAADTCLKLLRDAAVDGAVRQNAVRAVGEMGLTRDQPFFEALVACVRERKGFVEHEAARLLCRSGRPEAIGPVGEYLAVCPMVRRQEVELALQALNPEWWATADARGLAPAFLAAYRDGNDERRRFLIPHMARIADARFAPVLRQALEGGDAEFRPLAAAALRSVAEKNGLAEHLAWLDGRGLPAGDRA
jgi:hypothetical protein